MIVVPGTYFHNSRIYAPLNAEGAKAGAANFALMGMTTFITAILILTFIKPIFIMSSTI